MAEAMRANVAALLRGIDRYNPENLATLERYVEMQVQENAYDLEANLAVLKLYQFNPMYYQSAVTSQILLKALTNLPHTDFILCKCLIDTVHLEEEPVSKIIQLAEYLETCNFKEFWKSIRDAPDNTKGVTGFEDSTRKFICHVIAITYQIIQKSILAELLGNITEAQVNHWIAKYGWKNMGNGDVFVANQEESIKTKNITEKITFDSIKGVMVNAPLIPR